jgi:cobalt-zinc-cadmium efflux system protein
MLHEHHHHHAHDHGHHHHAPQDFGRAFMAGIILNTLFICAEVFWGLKANSLALLADAGHNTGDVMGLAMAWGAATLSRRKPSGRFTYGFGGSSIIAAVSNAVILLLVVGGIGWESLLRLARPEATVGTTMMAVAACGVLVNGASALFFLRGHHDLNVRGAFVHMAGDAAISLGVVISGAIILKTGWRILDPVTSLAISMLIVLSTLGLLKEALSLSLHAVPKSIDPGAVKAFLARQKGVKEVHDLHIWAMSTTEVACSVHLVMHSGHPGDDYIKSIAHDLEHDYGISHTTIQIELGDSGMSCPLAPDHVV